jgi:lipopolysaccharide/colanic/teichoic acid biosynthesis glycosyltransferase
MSQIRGMSPPPPNALSHEVHCMATLKLGLLPRLKKITDEPKEVTYFDKRLPFPAAQEAFFVQMLRLERRRTERSGRPFLLMLIEGGREPREARGLLFFRVANAIASSTRETDILGWYKQDVTLGLLMPEINCTDMTALALLTEKISLTIQRAVGAEVYSRLKITYRIFPQDFVKDSITEPDALLFPDLAGQHDKNRHGLALKRVLDIIGSLFALILFAPVFIVLAILVKASSKGPILFSQKRLGQYGKEFKFLKFRTMHANNDPRIHQEYVAKLIAGNGDFKQNGTFKLTNDPRITPLGRFLRKSSLDELPQLINVFVGQMSLVGPRPPLPYEYEKYQTWHCRRVMELKPGMTGLWQVEGRSRTTFDEMVRMDLRYASNRSLWLDVKILLQTPRAVLSGRGAC